MNIKNITLLTLLEFGIVSFSALAIPEYNVDFQETDCIFAVCCRLANWNNGEKKIIYSVQTIPFSSESSNSNYITILGETGDIEMIESGDYSSRDGLRYRIRSDKRLKVNIFPNTNSGTVKFCLTHENERGENQ